MQVIGCAGHGCYPPRMAHHKAVRDDPLKANWTGYPDLNPQESNANYNMHVARMAKLYANQRAVSQSVDCSMPRTMKVPPPWATTHTAIHDPTTHTMYIAGGYDGSNSFNDVWAFDLSSHVWTEVSASGDGGMTARHGHVAIYDLHTNAMYLMGGRNDGGKFNDVWAFLVSERVV